MKKARRKQLSMWEHLKVYYPRLIFYSLTQHLLYGQTGSPVLEEASNPSIICSLYTLKLQLTEQPAATILTEGCAKVDRKSVV